MIIIFLLIFAAPIHRCRNRGGHDISSCSSDPLPSGQRDLVCGANKPHLQYCHISALNGVSQGNGQQYYSFTNYEYFTADSAHATCAEVGGTVPSIRNESEEIWLRSFIEYFSSMVRLARPFTYRYISWPVRTRNIN